LEFYWSNLKALLSDNCKVTQFFFDTTIKYKTDSTNAPMFSVQSIFQSKEKLLKNTHWDVNKLWIYWISILFVSNKADAHHSPKVYQKNFLGSFSTFSQSWCVRCPHTLTSEPLGVGIGNRIVPRVLPERVENSCETNFKYFSIHFWYLNFIYLIFCSYLSIWYFSII
jgi:hypothetical protein